MKKIHRIRAMNTALYMGMYGAGVYLVYSSRNSHSFASGKLRGVMAAITVLLLVLYAWAAIRTYRESHNIREAFSTANGAFIAMVSIDWSKKPRYRKK